MFGASLLATVAWIEQRRAPPGSDQARRFDVHACDHVKSPHGGRGGWRVVHGGGGADVVGHVALAVLLRVAARLRAALLAVAVVGLDVLGQVVRPHEALVADRAREPLFPRVGAEVPLELV